MGIIISILNWITWLLTGESPQPTPAPLPPAPVPDPVPPAPLPPPKPVTPDFVTEVLNLHNQHRAENGVAALTLDGMLMESAQSHSDDMAKGMFMSHTGSDWSSPFDRMKSTGYQYGYAGENIAEGQRTPKEVTDAWMSDFGHRYNILSAHYTNCGIGKATDSNGTIYWTVDFAAPLG